MRKFASDGHKKAWQNFVSILQARTIVFMGGHILLSAILMGLSQESYHLSEKYLNEEGPINGELA